MADTLGRGTPQGLNHSRTPTASSLSLLHARSSSTTWSSLVLFLPPLFTATQPGSAEFVSITLP